MEPRLRRIPSFGATSKNTALPSSASGAAGVIVPPVKVGDLLYVLYEIPSGSYTMYLADVKEIKCCVSSMIVEKKLSLSLFLFEVVELNTDLLISGNCCFLITGKPRRS